MKLTKSTIVTLLVIMLTFQGVLGLLQTKPHTIREGKYCVWNADCQIGLTCMENICKKSCCRDTDCLGERKCTVDYQTGHGTCENPSTACTKRSCVNHDPVGFEACSTTGDCLVKNGCGDATKNCQIGIIQSSLYYLSCLADSAGNGICMQCRSDQDCQKGTCQQITEDQSNSLFLMKGSRVCIAEASCDATQCDATSCQLAAFNGIAPCSTAGICLNRPSCNGRSSNCLLAQTPSNQYQLVCSVNLDKESSCVQCSDDHPCSSGFDCVELSADEADSIGLVEKSKVCRKAILCSVRSCSTQIAEYSTPCHSERQCARVGLGCVNSFDDCQIGGSYILKYYLTCKQGPSGSQCVQCNQDSDCYQTLPGDLCIELPPEKITEYGYAPGTKACVITTGDPVCDYKPNGILAKVVNINNMCTTRQYPSDPFILDGFVYHFLQTKFDVSVPGLIARCNNNADCSSISGAVCVPLPRSVQYASQVLLKDVNKLCRTVAT